MHSGVKHFCVQSQAFYADSAHVFTSLTTPPADVAGLNSMIVEQTSKIDKTSSRVIEGLNTISSDSKTLICQHRSSISSLERLESRVSRSLMGLASIAQDIKASLSRLHTLSKELTDSILIYGWVDPDFCPHTWGLDLIPRNIMFCHD